MAILLTVAACKPPPDDRVSPSADAVERGKAVIERVSCGSCHVIPGVDWPRGRAGPSLEGFDDAGLLAGALPNTPANLAAFVRDAPAAKPGSTMPAMPITAAEAQDVAAYLYGMKDE
ncbi:c-type cytochrome [Pelagerythrobacter rhizovicinus]|uniref:c-type cytochrome n=1 Tax=Pelagerythrobacter rhizovicinus TaxID=2268576 RepID=UPI001CDD0802|nr:c-type cytochrome [Pelagerythrobacter rhizovicinus]